MGRWLSQIGKLAQQAGEAAISQVAEELVEDDSTLSKMAELATQCHESALQTMEVCDSTNDQRQRVIGMATEIQTTLTSLREGGQDASVLKTIQSLTEPSRMQEAADLARTLEGAATKCVKQSTTMIDNIEDGMDALPPMVQKVIELSQNSDQSNPTNDLLNGLDKDMEDAERCLQELSSMNLTTALPVGLQAFDQLSARASQSRDLFDQVHGFAQTIQNLTNVSSLKGVQDKARDLLECLRLTDAMRMLAEAAGKLVQLLVRLFEAAASKISGLWTALAWAKDCMVDCLEHVKQTQGQCEQALEQGRSLVTTSRSLQDKLESTNTASLLSTAQDLVQGGEISQAVALARGMDDAVMSCTEKVNAMVSRVQEGWEQLPPVLTEGISIETEGASGDDPELPAVEKDIAELETCQRALDEANLVSACKAGSQGFAGVSSKTMVCQELVDVMKSFCEQALQTIDSFLKSWDLESAAAKLRDMCRLANFGNLVKSWAKQCKVLIVAMVQLLQTALDKFGSKEGLSDLAMGTKDQLEDAVDLVKDKFKGSFKKFW